jgi:isorenieratene synthase
MPDHLEGEGEIRRAFLDELRQQFPVFSDVTIRHDHLQVRDDFTAYHTGLRRSRPGFATPVAGLYLAGDWVALPVPAMLMEAACTSGLLSANAILESEGLAQEPVFSVPLRGLLAGRGKKAVTA